MNKLQWKYNFLQIIYWITSCTIYGYAAVFLQSKGMSNTEIGIVTGAGAVISIFLSPFISGLLDKIKGMTIKKMMLTLYCIMFVVFIVMSFVPLPGVMIMVLYISLICLVVSNVPFLSMICMDYMKAGKYLNFGLARGMGSVSYATSAVVLGWLIEGISPNILAIVFCISGVALLALLLSMEDVEKEEVKEEKQADVSAFTIIKEYKTFFMILVAFAFMFAASSTLATYLINIVTNLGGSTSLYGVAIFCMAASEMPFMAVTHTLLKKFGSEKLILFASVCYILRNYTICLAPALPVLMIGMMFQGASYGLFTGVITYYVSDHLKPEHEMMGQTLIGMMSTGLGSTIGNVVGGVVCDSFGLGAMKAFAEIMTLTGCILMFFVIRDGKPKERKKLFGNY